MARAFPTILQALALLATVSAAQVAGAGGSSGPRAGNSFVMVAGPPPAQPPVQRPSNGVGIAPAKPVVSNPYNVPLIRNAGSLGSLR